MKSHTWLVVSLCLLAATANADDTLRPSGPVIDEFGPTFAIDNRDVALEEGFVYRAVFDASRYSGEPNGLNTTLVGVARFLNMHGRNGVATEKMQLAVVLHGEALKTALTDEPYRSRYDMANPNLELLSRLHAAGVRLYVCGQSMGFRDVAKQELLPETEVALSAMTMLTVLQSEGYALMP